MPDVIIHDLVTFRFVISLSFATLSLKEFRINVSWRRSYSINKCTFVWEPLWPISKSNSPLGSSRPQCIVNGVGGVGLAILFWNNELTITILIIFSYFSKLKTPTHYILQQTWNSQWGGSFGDFPRRKSIL